jgi:hypothetical protein
MNGRVNILWNGKTSFLVTLSENVGKKIIFWFLLLQFQFFLAAFLKICWTILNLPVILPLMKFFVAQTIYKFCRTENLILPSGEPRGQHLG